MTAKMTCSDCGCGTDDDDDEVGISGRHYEWGGCIAALKARIQSVEEELEAERETAEETNGFIDNMIAALEHPIRGDEVFLSEIVETAATLKARVATAEERTRAAVAASLASAAAVAYIGGLLGVDPSLPVEEFRETVIARVVELTASSAWLPVTGKYGNPGLPAGRYVVLDEVCGRWYPRMAYLNEWWFTEHQGDIVHMQEGLGWYLPLPPLPPMPDKE